MKFDRQLRPATETSWVVLYNVKTIPRWRTAAILKIDISPISQRKIIWCRWNFVHSSRFWTGWTSLDQKWKSCMDRFKKIRHNFGAWIRKAPLNTALVCFSPRRSRFLLDLLWTCRQSCLLRVATVLDRRQASRPCYVGRIFQITVSSPAIPSRPCPWSHLSGHVSNVTYADDLSRLRGL